MIFSHNFILLKKYYMSIDLWTFLCIAAHALKEILIILFGVWIRIVSGKNICIHCEYKQPKQHEQGLSNIPCKQKLLYFFSCYDIRKEKMFWFKNLSAIM